MIANRKFKACLFDMDGLLIDSETASAKSFSYVLINKFNKPQGLTWDVKVKMQGLPGLDACQVVVENYELEDVTNNIDLYKLISAKQKELWPAVKVLPGVVKLVKYLKEKNIPICVCTSSYTDKFELKTSRHSELFGLFDDCFITGDNPNIIGKGKPLPFIWWLGLDLLNQNAKKEGNLVEDIKPEECLIFEDAVSGFISGKKAGGYVIWVPDEKALETMTEEEIQQLTGKNNEYGSIVKSLEDLDITKFGL